MTVSAQPPRAAAPSITPIPAKPTAAATPTSPTSASSEPPAPPIKAHTILLYGRTNSGKTAQLGQLAEWVFKSTGKRTRLYTADKGGTDTIRPYINLGIIEAVELGSSNPWIFLNKAVSGHVRGAGGRWQPGDLSGIGLVAFESFRAFAEELMVWQSIEAGKGVNIGGGAGVSFTVQGDGESLKVGGSNQTHYKVAQDRMVEEIWRSLRLPVPFIAWTSSISKDEDQNASGKVLGPDVIGKALTVETPRWFNRTFRLDVLPAQNGKPERHLLYLGTHADINAGNAAGLGNIRMPLDAPALETLIIEPASIVKAIEMLGLGAVTAERVIAARLGLGAAGPAPRS